MWKQLQFAAYMICAIVYLSISTVQITKCSNSDRCCTASAASMIFIILLGALLNVTYYTPVPGDAACMYSAFSIAIGIGTIVSIILLYFSKITIYLQLAINIIASIYLCLTIILHRNLTAN